jgi:hypothetical protein
MSSEIADIEARDAALKDAQERERLSMQGEPGIPDGEWVYAASQAERDRRTLLQRIRELEAALKRIVLKDGRESIAVTKICDIARRALAGNTLGLEHPLDRTGKPK